MDSSYLKSILHYNPDTGIWVWLISKGRAKQGQQAGCLHKAGYRYIRIDGVIYKSSRLAWFYMTDEWPSIQVDHEDLIRSNDKWINLRLATHQQNEYNKKSRSTSKLGLKGVTFHKGAKKYQSYIGNKYLGIFNTPKEAKIAYNKAAKELHGEFFRE